MTELNALAVQLLQEACIEIHSSREDMDALLFAHELNELGSTLAHVALNAATKGWVMPERCGAHFDAALPLTCRVIDRSFDGFFVPAVCKASAACARAWHSKVCAGSICTNVPTAGASS